MKNGILVLGTSAINTHSFAAQLTGHPIAPDESVVPWTLQTKYYTANVRLWLDTLDDTSDVAAVVESLGDAVDGLVLLLEGPGVALCFDVSTASTPSTVADAVLDEAAAWCADNGLELVCAEDGEDPIQRVIQALEANGWDGLVMNDVKEKNVGGLAGTVDDDTLPSVTVAANWKAAAAAEFGDGDEDYLDLNQVLEREEGTLQSMLAEMNVNDLDDDEVGEFMASTGSQINAGAKKSEFDFDIPELDEFDPTNASQEAKDLRAALFGDVDDDDFFEKAIGQIKNLRESANSMSDDKRRDMARKLAMALLSDE
ncbi:hypothetical protein HDU79_004935 [Rhizoclosmatium sp. JEL0117]|nr:hypothetical protein HDU79_004935 [Rhizoclosmatium sp. JEL0117]